jgi:hypothetical protein
MMVVVIGLLGMISQRYPWFRLGRLPGDIVIERENSKFFLPLTSMFLVSIGISLGFALLRLFKR